MVLGLLATPCFAGSKTLKFAWQQELPTPINDMAGWKLYKSTTSGGPWTLQETIPYTAPATDYTGQTTITVPDGQVTTIYFTMTAFDLSGNESGRSAEVSARLDFQTPTAPTSLSVTVVTP